MFEHQGRYEMDRYQHLLSFIEQHCYGGEQALWSDTMTAIRSYMATPQKRFNVLIRVFVGGNAYSRLNGQKSQLKNSGKRRSAMTIKNGKFLIDLPKYSKVVRIWFSGKDRSYDNYLGSHQASPARRPSQGPSPQINGLEGRGHWPCQLSSLDKDLEESRGTKLDSIEITGCAIVIHLYGGTPTEATPQGASNCRYAYIGDVIIAVIKEAVPNTPLERSEMIKVVIVRTRKELKLDNGMIIQYDDNATIVIDQEGNPKGTRFFGGIARKLRQLNFTKIVSLAPEVYIS
ncbi:hypothetical protein Gotur_017846 [Gossypium turneri]